MYVQTLGFSQTSRKAEWYSFQVSFRAFLGRLFGRPYASTAAALVMPPRRKVSLGRMDWCCFVGFLRAFWVQIPEDVPLLKASMFFGFHVKLMDDDDRWWSDEEMMLHRIVRRDRRNLLVYVYTHTYYWTVWILVIHHYHDIIGVFISFGLLEVQSQSRLRVSQPGNGAPAGAATCTRRSRGGQPMQGNCHWPPAVGHGSGLLNVAWVDPRCVTQMMQDAGRFGVWKTETWWKYDGTTCYPQIMDIFYDEVVSEAISGYVWVVRNCHIGRRVSNCKMHGSEQEVIEDIIDITWWQLKIICYFHPEKLGEIHDPILSLLSDRRSSFNQKLKAGPIDALDVGWIL